MNWKTYSAFSQQIVALQFDLIGIVIEHENLSPTVKFQMQFVGT